MFLSKGDADNVFEDQLNNQDYGSLENQNRDHEKKDTAQALRMKMQQQQQAFMKRKLSAGSSQSGMVMSTNCDPVSGVTTPIQSMAQSTDNGSALAPAGTRSSGGGSFIASYDGAMVAPFHEETEQDLERRRRSRVDDMKDRGLAMVFDPSPAVNPLYSTELRNMNPEQMKAFLMNPLPAKGILLECRILREKTGFGKLYPKFVFETDTGVFLAASKKQTKNKTSNYYITMDPNDLTTKNEKYLGKVRSNFLGSEFTAFGPGRNPKDVECNNSEARNEIREEMVSVAYSSSLFGKKPRGPRKMSVYMPNVTNNGERIARKAANPQVDGLLAIGEAQASNPVADPNTSLVQPFVNKPPKWNEQVGAFVLNFNKRVTQASVKNFQLIRNDDPDMIYLQFGRIAKDTFNIDFRYPLSPFQAFAIALSSFDYKLCCE